jgi:predicted nucleic acid-binding protein
MNDKYFVDTNIVVYAFDKNEPLKQNITKQYLHHLFTSEDYLISIQVINEFCNIAQKKLRPALSMDNLKTFISLLPAHLILPISRPITLDALRIQHQYTLSFWDSMIVATAMNGSCRYLLTEDLSDGQKIETLTMLNPFKKSM